MDNLTHTLVGLMMSRCGIDRGERGTAAVMMLAANAPDIDAYPFFTDQLDYLEIHRGYTHALAFSPFIALLPIAIVAQQANIILVNSSFPAKTLDELKRAMEKDKLAFASPGAGAVRMASMSANRAFMIARPFSPSLDAAAQAA